MLLSGFRSSTGKEFQTDGPATEKARRPYVLSRCHGTEDRRRCRAGTSDTGVQQFARYCGASGALPRGGPHLPETIPVGGWGGVSQRTVHLQ